MSELLAPAQLRAAFGAFPSGVVAVAARVDGEPVGLAASSFTSVSLEPALVSVSLAAGSRTWPDLRRAERLGVTVLASQHEQLCRQLAGPVKHRFDGVGFSLSPTGAIFIEGGLATFDTTVHREVPAGDHVLVLLELHAVEHRADGGPLLFHRSGFGQLAPA